MADGKTKTGVVKKRASKREKKDWIAAYIFIAPVTIGLLVFYIWPFIQNIWFSFNDVNKFNIATFCGLDNYVKLFHDAEVFNIWKHFEVCSCNSSGRIILIYTDRSTSEFQN